MGKLQEEMTNGCKFDLCRFDLTCIVKEIDEMKSVEIASSIRRTFGNVNLCCKVFKSKKQYNRKNKDWKKED